MRNSTMRWVVWMLSGLLWLGGCSSGDDGDAADDDGAPTDSDAADGDTGESTDAVSDPDGGGAGSTADAPDDGDTPVASGSGNGSNIDASGIDRTGFMDECVSGSDNWGTEVQAGPCASGITRYGVTLQYGPYGARSEYNVGQGFENTVSAADSAFACSIFIDAFGADPEGSADLKDLHDLDLALYTVFYPGDMPEGHTFPLLAWGNGTCAMPEGYGGMLRYIASYGYIVIAPNSRYVGSGAAQMRGIDFMLAENDNPESPFYQKIDAAQIGAFGHSQGSGGTSAVSMMDERVSTVILLNGGANSSKPFLVISGDYDIVGNAPSTLENPVNASNHPAAYIWYKQVPFEIDGRPTGSSRGHLTLMMEPERVVEPVVAWFDMMLKDDEAAKGFFVGDDCTMCDDSRWPSMWASEEQLQNEPSFVYGKNDHLQ